MASRRPLPRQWVNRARTGKIFLLLRVLRVSVARKYSWLLVVFVVSAVAACGKKGPPLAPIMRIPGAIEAISARRSGSDVFITLTVPNKNIDSSMPVHISRVEVYGYT